MLLTSVSAQEESGWYVDGKQYGKTGQGTFRILERWKFLDLDSNGETVTGGNVIKVLMVTGNHNDLGNNTYKTYHTGAVYSVKCAEGKFYETERIEYAVSDGRPMTKRSYNTTWSDFDIIRNDYMFKVFKYACKEAKSALKKINKDLKKK